ncbi:unnamed protein product [Chrysoparadoxa australica]
MLGRVRSRLLCHRGPLTSAVRSFFIQTEDTPNPDSLKFLPGREVLPETHGSGMYFTRGDKEHKQSPLATALFKEAEDISGVFLGRDFITITKKGDYATWGVLKPQAFGAIMDFYAEGKAVISNEPVISDTTILEDDDEVVAMIKELLEERIRPAVQEDGGDIFYKGFNPDTGMVMVQLAGACSGCPSSSLTLKQGVGGSGFAEPTESLLSPSPTSTPFHLLPAAENMLMHYIPEVTGVEEVEDDELKELNEEEAAELENRLKEEALAKKLQQAGIPFGD